MRKSIFVITTFLLAGSAFGFPLPFKKKKYETPITQDTLQPDKVLFDLAIKDIEHGNYESARVVLNTLMNTYDTSEYLAKASLAIADSWYREGGAHGLAQAEAQYKEFILFFPNMAEAAESQFKVCEIHYKQMQAADRDSSEATRAEDECRQAIRQFPNSPQFAAKAEQLLREAQEVLADKEFRTGEFYHHRGSYPAAASRLSFLSRQYPLFSRSDQALWEEADSWRKMGDRFETQEGDALAKIVQDYPFSPYADVARERLMALKRSVPEIDPAAWAREKYDIENRSRPGLISRGTGFFTGRPDTSPAAKNGTPTMESLQPFTPVSVPAAVSGSPGGVSDVSVSVEGGSTILVASPTNHPVSAQQVKDFQKAQLKAQQKARKDARKKGLIPTKPADTTVPPATGTTPAGTNPILSA